MSAPRGFVPLSCKNLMMFEMNFVRFLIRRTEILKIDGSGSDFAEEVFFFQISFESHFHLVGGVNNSTAEPCCRNFLTFQANFADLLNSF